MRLVNLTPHTIRLRGAAGDLVIAPSGTVARVETLTQPAAAILGVPVVRVSLGAITGLPGPSPDVRYVTSMVVAQAAASMGRRDVISPDTGPDACERDETGAIVAVRRLRSFT